VHDDAEKAFELEMSWIGDETDGRHLPVPKGLLEEAEQKAKNESLHKAAIVGSYNEATGLAVSQASV